MAGPTTTVPAWGEPALRRWWLTAFALGGVLLIGDGELLPPLAST